MTDWADLYGEHTLNYFRRDVRHPFSTDGDGCAFDLDDTVVFAFEDQNDGLRSSCAPVLSATSGLHGFEVSSEYLGVPVLVSALTYDGGTAEGIELRDRRNGKVILRVGTSNMDDYYPFFTCDWMPENIAENEAR